MSSKHNNCYVCFSNEDNVIDFGELLPKNGNDSFIVHYFCVLLSADVPQNGNDDEGVYGFLINDIKKTARNYTKTKCQYCKKGRAISRCPATQCRTTFHARCAIKENCLAQFIEPEKFHVYCQKHSQIPRNSIGNKIKTKIRKDLRNEINKTEMSKSEKNDQLKQLMRCLSERKFTEENLCKICGESFTSNDLKNVITPPCCWSHNGLTPNYGIYGIHIDCVKFQAFYAGYKFKCPFCNDSKYFITWVNEIGVFVPKRHALWEDSQLENRSLLGITATCCAETCFSQEGREHFVENKADDFYLFLCYTCGSQAIHRKCLGLSTIDSAYQYKCNMCDIPEPANNYDDPIDLETDESHTIELHDTDSEPEWTAEQLFEEMDEIKPIIQIPKPIPIVSRTYFVQQRNHFRFQVQNWIREQKENGNC